MFYSAMVSPDAPMAHSEGVMARATALASQPCPLARPSPALWAMLTAVSRNARDRPQGAHILLQNADHVLGRNVNEASCQFDSPNVSGRHCTISRRYLNNPDGQNVPPSAATDRLVVTIRDSSSNGTFVNFQRLQRNGEEMQLRHGDVVSLVGTPENATAFSFVYREISDHVRGVAAAAASLPPCEPAGPSTKRKNSPPDDAGESVGGDGKRIKGIGNGNVSGPILLNDVRQLQRSNEELRVLVEAHVREVEKMRSEHRGAEARHASELKEVKAAMAEKYKAEQEELKKSLATKEAEAEASTASRLQLESNSELLQQRLASEAKSRVDAEEVIDGLKLIVGELEKLLEEERLKISKERAEAETSLRAALDRIRVEAAEELKRHEETALRQQEQQNEIILALQEGEKEYRAAAEISRKKLDSERTAVVAAEERARRLESQFQEEKVLSLSAQNRADDFEVKLRQTCKELEEEKVAREGAQVSISRLEVEMEAASRDLQLEKQRLQGARERIVLRETQMRAFHSTAAEIADLQQRQQGQLLTMIRALEDGDSDNDADNHTTTTSNVRSTAAPLQGSKRVQKTRKASQNYTSGSRPLQVTKRGDDKSKGSAMDNDDDTEGNTQRDDASHSSTTLSSDVNIPPTQVVDFQIASTYDEAGFHVQNVNGKLEFVQFTGGGDTVLEHGDAGCTQLANVDAGSTQLLTHYANLEGVSASARVMCEGVSAHQARSAGHEENPAVRRDGAEAMDEETEARPDSGGVRAGYLLDNTAQWDDGGADEDRGMMSMGASQAEAAAFKARHNHHHHHHHQQQQQQQRDSLCTADLLASEAAGSWAMATPASALGEDDSSSAERVEAPPVMRRLRVALDESAADYAASQVATNTVAGEKQPPLDGPADGKAAAHDVDMDMSQTTPKLSHHPVVAGVAGEALRLQDQQQRVPGGDGVLDLARTGRVGGAGDAISDDDDDDSNSVRGEALLLRLLQHQQQQQRVPGGESVLDLARAGRFGGARRDDDDSTGVRGEALQFQDQQQEQQQRVAGEIVLTLVRGRRVCGARRDDGDDDDDTSDSSSTEEGSREEGEIGASELRDSEPASSPLMFAH